MDDKKPRRTSTPRWGLRTLGFLMLAAAAVLTSNGLYARGNDDWVLLTFLVTIVGLVGAGVCTVRGLRSVTGSRPQR